MALTTCVLGLSGIALTLILCGQSLWAMWPVIFSIPALGGVLKEEKDGERAEEPE